MNVLIVEDEALSARRLATMIHEVDPSFHVVATTESVQDTVEWLKTHVAPDLLLLDIELTDGKSFDIFEQIEIRTPVIFVTAYDEYAIRAFKVNSVDYLLKPVKQEELARSIEKFKSLLKPEMGSGNINLQSLLQAFKTQGGYKDRFLVKQADQLLPIDVMDIAYFRTKDKQNLIYTFDGKTYPVDYTLDDIEKSLDPKKFFRANRQYLLNAAAVVKVHFWFSSKLKVDVAPKPGEDIIVSREKAMALRVWLGE
jgi:two-component system LytT family response regulator